MKFLGMGMPELLVILVVILLIFGPRNLPKLGSAIGKTIKGLREGMDAGKQEATEASDASGVEYYEEVATEPQVHATQEAGSAKTVKRVVVKKEE